MEKVSINGRSLMMNIGRSHVIGDRTNGGTHISGMDHGRNQTQTAGIPQRLLNRSTTPKWPVAAAHRPLEYLRGC